MSSINQLINGRTPRKFRRTSDSGEATKAIVQTPTGLSTRQKLKINYLSNPRKRLTNMYDDTLLFRTHLILTYETILDLIKFNGNSGIVNRKRQDTYKNAIATVKDVDASLDIQEFVKELDQLTKKPMAVMKELLVKGSVTLENKEPYNGVTIKDGVADSASLEAFKNLSVLLGLGIGIGDSGVKELVGMGFTSVDQLKDKLDSFRKGLQGPLTKYFEGTVRLVKMSRDEATKWRDIITKAVNNAIVAIQTTSEVRHKIAGSYARKELEIGDIDYVVVADEEDTLYEILVNVLDQLSIVTDIGDLPVELDSVVETPSRNAATTIKMWFKVGKEIKTKIEIYGYSGCQFCFPYFARSAQINVQKKIKIQAIKMGYRLSPYGLFIKDTDLEVDEDVIVEKIGKPIETIRDIFDFLDYSQS